MRKILPSILLLLASFSLQAQTYEYVTRIPIQTIQILALFAGIDLDSIDFDAEIDVYKVAYKTTTAQGDTVDASGALLVPVIEGCSMPLMAYHHFTVTDRENVPSRSNDEIQIGYVLATSGYVVAMPDFLGLGDAPGLHPYLHARTQATATIDMLRATRQLSGEIGFNMNEQLFLVGYSQGGHAAMGTHKYIEENLAQEFNITASNPMGGVYDLTNSLRDGLVADSSETFALVLPYATMSYMQSYDYTPDDMEAVFKDPYDELFAEIYDGSYGFDEVNEQVPLKPSSFLQDSIIESVINDPNSSFRRALKDNDLFDWTPMAPMRISHCKGDDRVSFSNAQTAYDTFIARGATDIELLDLGDDTHGACALPAFAESINYFRGFATLFDGIQLDSVTIEPSLNGAANGSITPYFSAQGTTLTYLWDAASSATDNASLDNLAPGNYTVLVTTAEGCAKSFSFDVGVLSAVSNPDFEITIAPNPVQHRLQITTSSSTIMSATLYDLNGKSVRSIPYFDRTGSMEVSNLAAGPYILRLQSGEEIFYQKIIKE